MVAFLSPGMLMKDNAKDMINISELARVDILQDSHWFCWEVTERGPKRFCRKTALFTGKPKSHFCGSPCRDEPTGSHAVTNKRAEGTNKENGPRPGKLWGDLKMRVTSQAIGKRLFAFHCVVCLSLCFGEKGTKRCLK